MSCGVGHRGGSDLALLWLWHRLVPAAPIGPLAWEPPYAAGVALKSKKQKQKQKQKASIPHVHPWMKGYTGEGWTAGLGLAYVH